MPAYSGITQLVVRATPASAPAVFGDQVIPYLVGAWRAGYQHAVGSAVQLVERSVSGVSYLFDVETGRLVASWGVTGGRPSPMLRFTYWDYDTPAGSAPAVQQGLLVAGRPPVITTYPDPALRTAC